VAQITKAHLRSLEAWNLGAPEVRWGDQVIHFDRVNGPFGYLRGAPPWARFRLCVRELQPGEEVNPVAERVKAKDWISEFSAPEIKSMMPGAVSTQVKRNRMLIQVLAEKGVPPQMVEMSAASPKPPGQWTPKHRYDIVTGMFSTPEGHPAKMDGSMWSGRGNKATKELVRERVNRETDRIMSEVLTGRNAHKITGLSEAQREYCAWVASLVGDVDRTEIAASLGVSVPTLRGWENLPAFKEQLQGMLRDRVRDPMRWTILLNSLEDMAIKENDLTAMKMTVDLMMKMGGPPAPKVDSGPDMDNTLSRMSDEDLLKLSAHNPVGLKGVATGAASDLPDEEIEWPAELAEIYGREEDE